MFAYVNFFSLLGSEEVISSHVICGLARVWKSWGNLKEVAFPWHLL